MGIIITPKALLESIKRNAFSGVDLSRVTTMSKEELRTFTLEQEERLLSAEPYGDLAAWLSDQFWTADKELIMIRDPHPWLESELAIKDLPELLDFSEEDYRLARWILHIALLSHDLFNHARFDLSVLGDGLVTDEEDIIAEEDFQFSNRALIDWIRQTPYRRIAALVCYQVLDSETNKAMETNIAVQDFYAMGCWRNRPDYSEEESCEEFTSDALDAMQQISDHYEEGHSKGLNDEEIRVLDAMYAFAPHNYHEEDFPCVRELCDTARRLLPEEPFVRSEQGCRQYVRAVFEEAKKILTKHEVDFDPDAIIDMTLSYIEAWIRAKYYE